MYLSTICTYSLAFIFGIHLNEMKLESIPPNMGKFGESFLSGFLILTLVTLRFNVMYCIVKIRFMSKTFSLDLGLDLDF